MRYCIISGIFFCVFAHAGLEQELVRFQHALHTLAGELNASSWQLGDSISGGKTLSQISVEFANRRAQTLLQSILKFNVRNHLKPFINIPQSMQKLDRAVANINLDQQFRFIQNIEGSTYTFLGYHFILTDLGFRPLSVVYERDAALFKKELYSNRGFLVDSRMNNTKNPTLRGYVFNTDLIFSWKFIEKCYPTLTLNPLFKKQIRKGTIFTKKNVATWVNDFILNDYTGGTQYEEYAFIFGLVPGIYQRYKDPHRYEEEQIDLFFKNPTKVGYLLLPGMHDIADNSDYIQLYALMLEYVLCKIYSQHYIRYMAYTILQNFIYFNSSKKDLQAYAFTRWCTTLIDVKRVTNQDALNTISEQELILFIQRFYAKYR